MKRRLVTRRGRRARRGGTGAVLATILLLTAALCVFAGGGALANLSALVTDDFFGVALAHEFPSSGGRADSILEVALSPVVSLVDATALELPPTEQRDDISPTAKPTERPTTHTKSDERVAELSATPSPTPTPSREPNGADLDPNIRTVTVSPTSTEGYDYADGVYVKNGTDYEVDVLSYLEALPEFDARPHILIVHTHACEAYYPDGDDLYQPTDVERTEDTKYNVVRVGDELEALLKERGFDATHIREIFDYPSYNGSYTRTLAAIEAALADDGEIGIIIDLHRDAIEGADGSTWRVVSDVDGRYAAQSMFVVGTDRGGLKHPNWRQNLCLAVLLQKYITDRYPTLMRPITLSPSRYNQHATSGSLILEVGASGNTLDEALYSIQLIGSATADFLEELCG